MNQMDWVAAIGKGVVVAVSAMVGKWALENAQKKPAKKFNGIWFGAVPIKNGFWICPSCNEKIIPPSLSAANAD